ncbi:reverse transcriptase, partial [Globisporangium splendens]
MDGSAFSVHRFASVAFSLTPVTNNVAEYRGLLLGLTAARRFRWQPLHVVGDSNVIVSQLQDYHSPKRQRLIPLYEECRGIANEIGVRSWTHHHREYNKMADKGADLAMDTSRSIQVERNSGWSEFELIGQFVRNDECHCLSRVT